MPIVRTPTVLGSFVNTHIPWATARVTSRNIGMSSTVHHIFRWFHLGLGGSRFTGNGSERKNLLRLWRRFWRWSLDQRREFLCQWIGKCRSHAASGLVWSKENLPGSVFHRWRSVEGQISLTNHFLLPTWTTMIIHGHFRRMTRSSLREHSHHKACRTQRRLSRSLFLPLRRKPDANTSSIWRPHKKYAADLVPAGHVVASEQLAFPDNNYFAQKVSRRYVESGQDTRITQFYQRFL